MTNEEYTKNFIKFKKSVTKPVIFENKLSHASEMQEMLEKNLIDFASVGRKWIVDPNWVNQVLHNKKEKPCLRCNYCLHTLWEGKAAHCAVNPQFGLEYEGEIQPAPKKKKVVVIGGGPGGITAALTAQKRGHEVILLEKKEAVGGKLEIVASPSYKKHYLEYLEYLQEEIKQSNIEVKTGVTATTELIEKYQADVVIVAIGAQPIVPPIPGIQNAMTADELLQSKKQLSGEVVIVGGGLVGCETAHVLAQLGCKVHIVEMQDDVLKDTSYVTRHSQLDVLEKTGAQLHVKTKLKQVNVDGIIVEHDGVVETLKADHVINAMGYRNQSPLYDELLDSVEEVYQIGDCKRVRKIADAVNEGYQIAKNI